MPGRGAAARVSVGTEAGVADATAACGGRGVVQVYTANPPARAPTTAPARKATKALIPMSHRRTRLAGAWTRYDPAAASDGPPHPCRRRGGRGGRDRARPRDTT